MVILSICPFSNGPIPCPHFLAQMWACALGHLEAAVVLYKWDRRALAIPDSLGRLPLAIARSRGHTKLADRLEQLQREEQPPPSSPPSTPRVSFSPTPDPSAHDGWMVAWNSEPGVAPTGHKGGVSTAQATPLNPGEGTSSVVIDLFECVTFWPK